VGGLFFLFKGGSFRGVGVFLGIIFISCAAFFIWRLPASIKEERSTDVHKYFLVLTVQEFDGTFSYITYNKKSDAPIAAKIFYDQEANFRSKLSVRITYLYNVFGSNITTVYHLTPITNLQ
jgi:hypothetical protein